MSISWRYLVRTLGGLFLVAALGMTAQAQTGSIPGTITYTGFLRDNSTGDPVSGTKNFTFELFDAATGGTALWTESQNGIPVAGGVFSVDLGSAAPFADQELTFDRPLFLAITVDGEPMDARLPLSSAPYALRSGEGVSNVSVSCTAANPDDHDSIQEAIDKAPAGGPLIVTIEGICIENVNLERDRVTFLSATDTEPNVKGGTIPTDGIRGTVDNSGALQIDGASDIIVRGLVLENTPGSRRRGIWVFDNGSVELLNVLLRNSWAGALANHGGFTQTLDSQIVDNTGYGLLFMDAGHGRIEDTNVIHHVSVTGDADEGAVAAFRSSNVRLRGKNQIINAGDDGLYDANDPDAASNSDNGLSIYVSHGVQVRQDRDTNLAPDPAGDRSLFVGKVSASNQVQVSLRDAELIGDISLSGNSLMDMRENSDGGQELSAREVNVGNHSRLSFARNNMQVKATRKVSVSNHSILGISKDSTTADFCDFNNSRGPGEPVCRVNVNNFSEVTVRGDVTIHGDVNVNGNSDFNSWRQTNAVDMDNLRVTHQSRANLRGAIGVNGDLGASGNSVVDLNDEDRESTTDKTVVNVGGRLDVNDDSFLNIANTAVMNVTGDASFHRRGNLDVSGFFEDPPDCEVCAVDNASELNVLGSGGLNVNQHSTMSVRDGGVVTSKSLEIGPFVTVNLNGGSEIEVQDSGTPGPIVMYAFNQVFWNGGSDIIGNITLGTYSIVNVDGPGNGLNGGFFVHSGLTPGVLNVKEFGFLNLESGNIDCNGQALNSGTVNVDGTVTFSGGGDFVNCGL